MDARDPLEMIGPHTIVWSERTDFFDAAIVDSPELGRSLFLDGVLQSAAVDEARYHAALIEPALRRLEPGPRDVLILGAGECATIRDVLAAADLQRVLAVDIDGRLMHAVREHLGPWHAGSLDDPRVTLRIEDARATLAASPAQSFDLVVVDLTDAPDGSVDAHPADEETAPLLDLAFLREVARVLRPGGVVTLQAGEATPPKSAGIHDPVPALREVFAHVTVDTLFIASFDLEWNFVRAWGDPDSGSA